MSKSRTMLAEKMRKGLERIQQYKERTGYEFYTPKPGKPTGLSVWQLVGRGVPLLDAA